MDDSLDFLAECGLSVQKLNPRQYQAKMPALPELTVLFQRPGDIVVSVRQGSVDFGITGIDVLEENRGDNGEILSARTSQWCQTRTVAEALEALARAKVPAGPVLSPQQLLDDPHVNAAGFLAPISFPGLTAGARIMTTPVVLSDTPGRITQAPPVLGQHTEELLSELGITAEEVESLRREGVI